MLVSSLGYKQIDLGRELDDSDVLEVIKREVKKRKEAVASYLAGGRQEQADSETAEMKILQEYLPEEMAVDEVRRRVKQVVEANKGEAFGVLMKKCVVAVEGGVEGGVVAQILKEEMA
jgi:uncharacterized protein YqeY